MTGNQIMFIIFSAIIVLFSILTVTSRRILRAATYLLFVLVSTAGLYFMLNYQFLAAVQLTVYAGGIVVLIIFSILLTSHINQKFEPVGLMKIITSAMASLIGAALCIVTLVKHQFVEVANQGDNVDMKVIGRALLGFGKDGYVLPFEVISILLLAAMIGAIVIAKKGKGESTVESK